MEVALFSSFICLKLPKKAKRKLPSTSVKASTNFHGNWKEASFQLQLRVWVRVRVSLVESAGIFLYSWK